MILEERNYTINESIILYIRRKRMIGKNNIDKLVVYVKQNEFV